MQNEADALIERIDREYQNSTIAKQGKSWYYSLAATRTSTNGIVTVGTNFGSGLEKQGYKYEKQRSIPDTDFDSVKLGSFNRIKGKLKAIAGDDYDSVVHTNYCFFRSWREHQILPEDFERCKPIFLEFMNLLQPKMIFSFSSRMRNDLINDGSIRHPHYYEPVEWTRRGGRNLSYQVLSGNLAYRTIHIPVIFLPHPAYGVGGEARSKTWESAAEFYNLHKG